MAMRCLIFGAVYVLAVAAIALPLSARQATEDLSALNAQVVELYQAGKDAETISASQRALARIAWRRG